MRYFPFLCNCLSNLLAIYCFAEFFLYWFSLYIMSVRLIFLNKLLLLFIMDISYWPKVSVKTFIMLQNIAISNKCCSLELSIHLWILKNKMYHVSTKILSSTTVFNIDNNQKCFLSILLWFLKIMWHWRLE